MWNLNYIYEPFTKHTLRQYFGHLSCMIFDSIKQRLWIVCVWQTPWAPIIILLHCCAHQPWACILYQTQWPMLTRLRLRRTRLRPGKYLQKSYKAYSMLTLWMQASSVTQSPTIYCMMLTQCHQIKCMPKSGKSIVYHRGQNHGLTHAYHPGSDSVLCTHASISNLQIW